MRLTYLPSVVLAALIIGVFWEAAFAAELEVPVLSPALVVRDRLNSGNVVKTGIRLAPTADLVFEPQFGLGHVMWEREVKSGFDEITHKIHAQAGGQVDLFGFVSLSAAAKLPVYTAASSDRWLAGSYSQPGEFRHDYDILRNADKLSWTGEMGLHLGPANINLFYDKSRFDDMIGGSRLSEFEETFGTRLIFRFR